MKYGIFRLYLRWSTESIEKMPVFDEKKHAARITVIGHANSGIFEMIKICKKTGWEFTKLLKENS